MRQHAVKNDKNYTERAWQPHSMIKRWQASQQLIHQRDTHVSLEAEKLTVCDSFKEQEALCFTAQLYAAFP